MKILEKNGIFIDKEKAWKIWEEISNEKYELKIFSDVYDNLDYLKQKNKAPLKTGYTIKKPLFINPIKNDWIHIFAKKKASTTASQQHSNSNTATRHIRPAQQECCFFLAPSGISTGTTGAFGGGPHGAR